MEGNILFNLDSANLRQLGIAYRVNRFEASEGSFLKKIKFTKNQTQGKSTERIFT